MARPERNDVDYFPFLCKEGKAMYYIEQTYGNDGYATWVRILRQLAVTNYHYLNLKDKVEFMFLSSKCRVSQEVLNSIIQDLCDLGEFNKELWTENKVIFSEKLVGSLKDAYDKRNNECITLDSLLALLSSLGVRKLIKSNSDYPVNAQTKVKETKVKKSIYPFASEEYLPVLIKWLDYKKKRREGYKTDESIILVYNKIVRLSNNDPKDALKIVEESMSNNWAGLFELSNKKQEEVVLPTQSEPSKW